MGLFSWFRWRDWRDIPDITEWQVAKEAGHFRLLVKRQLQADLNSGEMRWVDCYRDRPFGYQGEVTLREREERMEILLPEEEEA